MKTKRKEAPDWFGCGKVITQKSWDAFIAARATYYAEQDARNAKSSLKRCEAQTDTAPRLTDAVKRALGDV